MPNMLLNDETSEGIQFSVGRFTEFSLNFDCRGRVVTRRLCYGFDWLVEGGEIKRQHFKHA